MSNLRISLMPAMGMDGGVRPTGLNETASTVSAAALEDACDGLARTKPHLSAKRRLYWTQLLAIAVLIAGLVWAARQAPGVTFGAAYFVLFVLFGAAILIRLVAAASLSPTLSRLAAPERFPTYTILCPLYREANVAHDLVTALSRLDYPTAALDIRLLVEADDIDTIAAAQSAAAEKPHIEVVIIPPCAPRTKPKALNVGLAEARGSFVCVYDAEDRPHPQQLRAALAAFEQGGERLACVQAPLSIDNAGASWISRQFAAEYAIQFREMLPLLARLELPLPLGGTSNHFQTDVLRQVGGWDPYNVTEDADLGYRLARAGYRSDVIGPPTMEEAPVTLNAWLKQRTRWIKGHLQTWLVLMRDPVGCARQMGLAAFISMQLVFATGLVAAFAHGPLALILLTALLSPYDLLTASDFVLAISGYCVAIFAALTACALSGSLSHAWAAPTMPLYWPLASIAAYCALFELFFRPHYWSKTAHGISARPSLVS
ncbi:MAG: glycosyltransferase [Hyphomonadaceae bacterium]|nr:glycosyltransferase [Hyphomonadaceae bacterium]